jgi:hypothetical protein
METEIAGIGHNMPPNDVQLLNHDLETKADKLIERQTQLLAAVNRIPATCEDDVIAGKIGDLIKQIGACTKSLNGMRVSEKEPYLTLGRTVDGFFNRFIDDLDNAKSRAARPLENYLRKKEDEKRAAAAEAARVERERAEQMAREAQELEAARMHTAAQSTMNEAVRAEEQAVASEKIAESKPADLARTRGDYGSVSTLRTTWAGEILDRNALDLKLLMPYISEDVLQKALNAFVKAGGRSMAGAKIFEKSTATVR